MSARRSDWSPAVLQKLGSNKCIVRGLVSIKGWNLLEPFCPKLNLVSF